MQLDLIVEGGTVVTGNDTYRADVGVAGGKVVALGVENRKSYKGRVGVNR